MKTNDNPEDSLAPQGAGLDGRGKKPYQKPAFRHERVFETRALTCGKVQPTQGTCTHNRSAS